MNVVRNVHHLYRMTNVIYSYFNIRYALRPYRMRNLDILLNHKTSHFKYVRVKPYLAPRISIQPVPLQVPPTFAWTHHTRISSLQMAREWEETWTKTDFTIFTRLFFTNHLQCTF
ncbi:hypothetical protein CW304_05155 [Bacillus sp. UFRGS-B20]|nr:hypothetical protein CW304_05155 [Bacillus sp. UFRGS-B20]